MTTIIPPVSTTDMCTTCGEPRAFCEQFATDTAQTQAADLETATGFRVRLVPDIEEGALVLENYRLVLVDAALAPDRWEKVGELVRSGVEKRRRKEEERGRRIKREAYHAALKLAAYEQATA